MLPPKTILFVSDIHLSAQAPALHELFISFLQGPARAAEKLFILGDLFDAWVGHDINTVYQQTVQQELKALAATGVQLFFMAGNRDFLIQTALLKTIPCQKLADPCLIDLQGIPTILTHGDLLCTQDKAYQRYRRIAQHPLVRFLFLCLPQQKRAQIGQKLRLKSQQYQEKQTSSILDADPAAAKSMAQKYQVKQLIHGHVHRPKIHQITPAPTPAKRIVLGDWHTNGSVIISTPTEMILATYSSTAGLQNQASYTLEELTIPLAE